MTHRKIFRLVCCVILSAVTLAGCLSSSLDEEYDLYEGTISQPNPGKRTLSANSVSFKLWFNTGQVEGSGKVIILETAQMAGDITYTETFNLKFTGTYDQKTKMLNGLVAITGGMVCSSNCALASNTTYDHSSYWQAKLESGRIVNGMISAYPDFKVAYFNFEAGYNKE